MALCRCLDQKPKGRKENYVIYKEPVGYPKSSSICGRKNCENRGLIWLTKKELAYYNKDKKNRVFSYASAVSKVRVK